jgi:DNA-directed RNA polymerase specialized sigma24 family protein
MDTSGSVTHWIGRLKAGDHAAAQKLWEAYFEKLVRKARQKLQGMPRRVADEEDVALSAFHSFCRCASQGRFPRLDDSGDLWQLLVMLTARKAARLREHERRQKRGGGEVRGESALIGAPGAAEEEVGIEQVVGGEPSPEYAAQVAEECQRLLARLPDEKLRELAQMKMEGYSNEEIAVTFGCGLRTVERKLARIRIIWESEVSP